VLAECVNNFGGDAVGLLNLDVFTVQCNVFHNADLVLDVAKLLRIFAAAVSLHGCMNSLTKGLHLPFDHAPVVGD
jgi:hypothetical protein